MTILILGVDDAAPKRNSRVVRCMMIKWWCVSGSEPYEVYYVARKYGVRADTVRKVIKRVGNSRKKVYAALEKM
ncbi:MAG TPA: DUF3606 domain-containing protein [Pseudolabrys sp.]|nr:DUF3606 domain-containing protein [Pseudolabrys sp.]